MMKVTLVATEKESVTLKVEGRIGGQWVDVLKSECRSCLAMHERLILDFSGVDYIDEEGIAALKAMVNYRVTFIGVSLFLSGLLEEA